MADNHSSGFLGNMADKSADPDKSPQKSSPNTDEKSAPDSPQANTGDKHDDKITDTQADKADQHPDRHTDQTSGGKSGALDTQNDMAKKGTKNSPGGILDTSQDSNGRQGFTSSLGKKSGDKQQGKNPVEKARDTQKKVQKGVRRAKQAGIGAKYGAETYLFLRILDALRNMLINFLNFVTNLPLVNIMINAAHMLGSLLSAGAHALGHLVGGIAHGIGAGLHAIGGAFMAGAHGVAHATSTSTAVGVTVMSLAATTATGAAVTPVVIAILSPKDGGSVTCTMKKAITSLEIDAVTGGAGSWSQKGTKQYNMAKQMYIEAKKLGCSDAAAAGIVGQDAAIPANNAESAFDPKAIESGGGGGVGLFQFTGQGSKYGWDMAGQVKSILANNDAGKVIGPNARSYMKMTDPYQAGARFCREWERPSASLVDADADARGKGAMKIYAMFNGLGGEDETNLDNANENSATASNNSANSDCSTGTPQDTADGTGTIKEDPSAVGYTMWAANAVPSDVQAYIHDPKDAGMGFGNKSGWYNYGGQCVHFASSYFHLIYNTSATPMVDYGKNEVTRWSQEMKGTVSTTPHEGDIASTTSEPLTGGNSAGHTYIVEHVLANGDIIIAQQNWPKLSGDDAGKAGEWCYGVLSKKLISSDTKFFHPDQSKYHLNWNGNK